MGAAWQGLQHVTLSTSEFPTPQRSLPRPHVHERSLSNLPDVKFYLTEEFVQSYPDTTVSGRHKLQKVEYQVLQAYLRHLESK